MLKLIMWQKKTRSLLARVAWAIFMAAGLVHASTSAAAILSMSKSTASKADASKSIASKPTASKSAVHPAKDEDLPIQIQSDRGDFDDKTGNATHRGHVVVDQGSRHLTSDVLVIHRTTEGKIDHMTAYGKDTPVRFHALPDPNKSKLEGEAKIMKFFPNEDKIILLDNAMLTQNNHTVRGPIITYLLNTRVLSSESDANQRTTIIIPSKETSKEKING